MTTARNSRPRAWARLAILGGLVTCALSLGAFSLGAATAEAQAREFEEARDAYERGEYQRVVELLEPLVGGELPTISDRILIRESRKYLGAAYALTGDRPRSVDQFEALLRAEGDAFDEYRLDPAAFPSEVHEVFDEIQGRLRRQRQEVVDAQERARLARDEERRAALLGLVALAQEAEVEVENDRLLAWVPFGVGQFQNDQEALGIFFATSEAILLVTWISSIAIYAPLLDEYERARDFDPTASVIEPGLLVGLSYLNWFSGGAFLLTALIGVLEAHLGFVPSRRVRRPREVPPDVLERLELVGAPGGLGVRLRF